MLKMKYIGFFRGVFSVIPFRIVAGYNPKGVCFA